jgi:hypothetical protein
MTYVNYVKVGYSIYFIDWPIMSIATYLQEKKESRLIFVKLLLCGSRINTFQQEPSGA